MDLKRLRGRIERRARELGGAPATSEPRQAQVLRAAERDRRGAYSAGKLLDLDGDEAFVQALHRALLCRPPTRRETTRAMALASNKYTRAWLMLSVRYGSEGRVRDVRLRGRSGLLLRGLPGLLMSIARRKESESRR